jgi:hypothetical protein
MESEFAKIIYAKINGIPWQPQITKFVSRQKKTKQKQNKNKNSYTVHCSNAVISTVPNVQHVQVKVS